MPALPIFVRSTALLAIAALLAAVMATSPSRADPAREAPWLPEAAAYRLTLFLGNLTPVPWDKIERAWGEPYRGSEFATDALDRISARSALDATALRTAIAAEDRDALFAAATRLVTGRIEEELDRALGAEPPAEAQRAVAEAQGLYRAFADHLAAADAEGAQALGRAWLELASNTGSSGVLGAGAVSANADRMQAARQVISDYLAVNYLPDTFTPRVVLSAIPEAVIREGRAVDLPPSLPPGTHLFDQDPLPRLVLNFEEQGIDEADLPLVAFGDMLFDSPEIFGDPARSLGVACSSCHNRSDVNRDLFIPGASHVPGGVDVDGAFFNPIFNDRRDDPLDIPSMRGIRFTGPYGRDGRFASLREFTRNVIVNEFAGDEPTPFMLDALVAYMTEFDFLPNSYLTTGNQLSVSAPEAAQRGEEIFKRPFAGLDGMSCALCHQPSSNFLDRRSHDIGSAPTAYDGSRSGAFDTPTLLGTVYTAPYFHDGSLPTLAAVVDWFNDTKELGLNETERADLIAYLETVGAADNPYEEFDDRNTPFRLTFEELTTFASTLDTLLPRRDVPHITLLVNTVASDLALDAATMGNLAARPDIYRLADILEGVGEAATAGDWSAAQAQWESFKAEAAAMDERVY